MLKPQLETVSGLWDHTLRMMQTILNESGREKKQMVFNL